MGIIMPDLGMYVNRARYGRRALSSTQRPTIRIVAFAQNERKDE